MSDDDVLKQHTGGRPIFHRVIAPAGSRITFRLDGDERHGHQGDTVLTAILTNSDHVRSFEFANSLRAGFCLIGACQDCWVNCSNGRRLRACSTLLIEGMEFIT